MPEKYRMLHAYVVFSFPEIFDQPIFVFAIKLFKKDADFASNSIFIPTFLIQAQKPVLLGNTSVKKRTGLRKLVKKGFFFIFSVTPFENTRKYAIFDRSQCSIFDCQSVIKHYQLGVPWRLINAGEIQGAS